MTTLSIATAGFLAPEGGTVVPSPSVPSKGAIAAQKTAFRLISSKGTTLNISREVAGDYSPISGELSFSSSTWSVPALIQTYSRAEVDGTMIQQNDFKLLIPGTSPRPLSGDTFTIDGVTSWVVNVETLTKADLPVMFTVQCRK